MNAVPQRGHDAVARVREVTDHPVREHLARVGLVVYGVLRVLIGWLAFRIAWFVQPSTEDADQTGALPAVADSPGGEVLLRLIGVGLFTLAFRQAGGVLRWWSGLLRPEHRLRSGVVCAQCAATTIVYAALGVTALFFAVGGGYRADERFHAMTDGAFQILGGSALVVAVGLGVAAVGLYQLVRGVTGPPSPPGSPRRGVRAGPGSLPRPRHHHLRWPSRWSRGDPASSVSRRR